MNKFQQITPQPTPPAYSDRQFLHTFLAGAFLPLVQASITAIMAGVITLIVLYKFRAMDILEPTLIVMAVAWAGTWLFLQRRWLNLTALERALNLDINRDGHIGEPSKPQMVVRVDKIKSNGHYQSSKYTFKISDEQLLTFARGLMNGIPISRRRWSGTDKIFSEPEYRAFQSDMIKFQLIESGGNGFVLTEDGEEFFENYLLQHSPSPPPDVETGG